MTKATPGPMSGPDFTLETDLIARGLPRIAGVDEVGRGPLAGPVTAAAVVLDPDRIPDGLNDSKKLTEKRRLALLEALLDCAEICVAHASVAEIDALNILRASHLAMERAVAGLKAPPDHLLIDGNLIPRGLTRPATAVVKGDARSVSIAAASIAATIACWLSIRVPSTSKRTSFRGPILPPRTDRRARRRRESQAAPTSAPYAPAAPPR